MVATVRTNITEYLLCARHSARHFMESLPLVLAETSRTRSGKSLFCICLNFLLLTGKMEVMSGISIRLVNSERVSYSPQHLKIRTRFGNDHCHSEGVNLLLRLILSKKSPNLLLKWLLLAK